MNLKEVILKCNGIILNPEILIPETFCHIKTDTRELEPGDVFIALKGNNYDGHQYIKEAKAKGASAIVVEEDIIDAEIPIIKVASTYEALFDIARLYLETYPVFVVAVTGSVGKTTTKELIATMLGKKYHVLKSKGNKNNRIGIPQTIFELDETIDCLVVELGMNHLHEIEKLSLLVKPNIAVITNIGSAHIGNLGSKKNILKAKMEIIKGMDGGILFLNGHDSLLNKTKKIKAGKIETVYKNNGTIRIELQEQTVYGSHIIITNGIETYPLFFESPGEGILEDIALALHIGDILEVPFSNMVEALKEFKPKRFLVTKLESGNILINDSYNSSYEALMLALNLLRNTKEHKTLILGDILELGKSSKKIHKKIGKELRNFTNTSIYFIGPEMKYAWKTCKKGKHFIDNQEFIKVWESEEQQSIIFLKGSRKMKLEELIPYIK